MDCPAQAAGRQAGAETAGAGRRHFILIESARSTDCNAVHDFIDIMAIMAIMLSATPQSARLFFGFWPSHEVATAIGVWRKGWELGDTARLSPVANLHVTLQFLGDVRRGVIPGLISAAQLQFRPSRVDVGSPDLWPEGIALLHVSVSDTLQSLRIDLNRAVKSLGLPAESRPWQPHLTLARRATPGAAAPLPILGWTMNSFSLLESTQGKYREIAAFSAQ